MTRLFNCRLIICIVLQLSCCTCHEDHSVRWSFINNTSQYIEFLFPQKQDDNVPFLWGNMDDVAPDDTTMQSAGAAHFGCQDIPPRSMYSRYSGFNYIEEMSNYNIVRVFVYDGDFHYDFTLPPNQVFIYYCENEKYFCRYDLSIEDIKSLVNQNNEIEICFPPDERMASMKMWPPYETVLKECAERESETR